jgi:hypothetical protein
VVAAVVVSTLVCGPAMAVDPWDTAGIRYPLTSGAYTGSWYDTMNPANKNFYDENSGLLDCGIQLQDRITVNYGKTTSNSILIKSVTVKYWAYHQTRTYPDVPYIQLGMYNLGIWDGKAHRWDKYFWAGTGATRNLYLNNTVTLTYTVNKTYYLGPNDPSNYYNYTQVRVDFSAPAYSLPVPGTFGAVTCMDADILNLYGYYSTPV